jgi:hypothetical protein
MCIASVTLGRQKYISVPDPNPFEDETAIANLEKYTSSGSDQILPELDSSRR